MENESLKNSDQFDFPTQEVPPPKNFQERIWRNARKIGVFIIGITVLLIGIVMIVTPGPALVVIPVGLAILATEFAWARWLLKYSKKKLEEYTSIKT
jgi:uncharacterized protein (TIGR02611 family)